MSEKPNPSLKDLLSVAADAAYLAGRRTLAYFNAEVAVEHKPDDTPVTRADREAEQVIRERVARFFPGPLDRRRGARGDRGQPRLQVDHRPDRRHQVVHPRRAAVRRADRRRGSRPAERRRDLLPGHRRAGRRRRRAGLHVERADRPACRRVDRLEDATLLAGSITRALARSDAYGKLATAREAEPRVGRRLRLPARRHRPGGGHARPAINPWDCARCPPILREAGGRFTTWAGEETIWGPDGCATNGAPERTGARRPPRRAAESEREHEDRLTEVWCPDARPDAWPCARFSCRWRAAASRRRPAGRSRPARRRFRTSCRTPASRRSAPAPGHGSPAPVRGLARRRCRTSATPRPPTGRASRSRTRSPGSGGCGVCLGDDGSATSAEYGDGSGRVRITVAVQDRAERSVADRYAEVREELAEQGFGLLPGAGRGGGGIGRQHRRRGCDCPQGRQLSRGRGRAGLPRIPRNLSRFAVGSGGRSIRALRIDHAGPAGSE